MVKRRVRELGNEGWLYELAKGTKKGKEGYGNSSASFGICFSSSVPSAIKAMCGNVCGHHSTS